MRRATAVLVGAWLCWGCGPEVDSGSGGEEDGDGGRPVDVGTPEDDGAAAPDAGDPSPCGPGFTLCGENECVDLQMSNDHCGRCDNKCPNPFTIGTCEAGVCPPNLECGGARTDFRDCDEVCAGIGQSCNRSDWGCSGHYNLYYDEQQGINACEAGLGQTSVQAQCSDPIDWGRRGGLALTHPVAVACCCTQE